MSYKNQQIKSILLSLLLLTILILSVYWQVQKFEFLNFDDLDYVVKNKNIQNGLNLKFFKWAFFNSHSSNWHPITWLSHLLDFNFYGLKAGEHHFTNVLIHLLNSIILFFIIFKIRKRSLESFFVALLFAIHPVHTESIVWIAERKDMLFTFFGFLSVYYYIDYSREEKGIKYLLTFFFFALSLMSKSMLVTLPFLFLLFDFSILPREKSNTIKIFCEKIPFILFAILVSVLIIKAQESGGVLRSFANSPLEIRASNALVSYMKYIGKIFYPLNLSPMYLHPKRVQFYPALFSLLTIFVISLFAIFFRKKAPFLFLGWFWFLLTLVPVIGIVQVGDMQMADRYLYFPAIGIYIIFVIFTLRYLKSFGKITIILIIASLLLFTFKQAGYWKNSITLYRRTIKVMPKHRTVREFLYLELMHSNKYKEAEEVIKTLIINNKEQYHTKYYKDLGLVYLKQGRVEEAILILKNILSQSKNDRDALGKLLFIYIEEGRIDEAKEFLTNFFENKDELINELYKVANVLISRKRYKKALLLFTDIIRLNDKYKNAYLGIALIYEKTGNNNMAIKYLLKTLSIEDTYNERKMLATFFVKNGNNRRALKEFLYILDKWGGNFDVYLNLGKLYSKLNSPHTAQKYFQLAQKIEPNNEELKLYFR